MPLVVFTFVFKACFRWLLVFRSKTPKVFDVFSRAPKGPKARFRSPTCGLRPAWVGVLSFNLRVGSR